MSNGASAYLNAIGTAVPANEVHGLFAAYAPRVLQSRRDRRLFERMVQRCGIERRHSVLAPGRGGQLDDAGLYVSGRFADTGARMRVYEAAPRILRSRPRSTSMMIYATSRTCSWSLAPICGAGGGLCADRAAGAQPGRIERTSVGFMGCHAALNALRLAGHIVRSEPKARVLVICLELCTLHLQETADLEQVLAFLIFADGCAAALVTGEPRGRGSDARALRSRRRRPTRSPGGSAPTVST